MDEPGQLFEPIANWARSVELLEDPTFIIPGFIPSDSLVLLSGQPKDAKKTMLAQILAIVASTGQSIGVFKCPKPVNVGFIYQEGAPRPTLARFDAISKGHGLPDIRDNPNLFIRHRKPFFLDEGNWVDEVCAEIRERDLKLVFIDTVAKSIRADENSAKEIGRAISECNRMREAGATVVLLHHLKKGRPSLSGGTSGLPEPDGDYRGSSAFAGAYEFTIAIRCYADDSEEGRTTKLFTNGKEQEWQEYTYDWDFVNGVDHRGEEYTDSIRLDCTHIGKLQPIVGPKRDRRSKDD